jgi:hypothetical protein
MMHHEKVPLIYPFKKWSEHAELTVPITERLAFQLQSNGENPTPPIQFTSKNSRIESCHCSRYLTLHYSNVEQYPLVHIACSEKGSNNCSYLASRHQKVYARHTCVCATIT